ncbi:membrane fusion protein (MFP) component of efflux pump [Klebsiella michiganensis]|nr:membrane fusion protein (MFP) component of efflux pump [Klebsiella michiganensis]
MTRAVEPGSMLSAGGTVMTLSLTPSVWVRAYIDEKNLGQAQPGREVLLYTDSRPDKPYRGKIGFRLPYREFTPKTVETPDLRTDLVYRLRIVVTDATTRCARGCRSPSPSVTETANERGRDYAEGLTRRFAGMDRPAVAPLDCTIHSGYVTGLVGPDGAGKTP